MAQPPPLPNGFTPLQSINSSMVGRPINIIGIVVGRRDPIQVSKNGQLKDWTMSLNLCDKTQARAATAVQVRFFKPTHQKLPSMVKHNDAIVIFGVTVSAFRSKITLLSNAATESRWIVRALPDHQRGHASLSSYPPQFSSENRCIGWISYLRYLMEWWKTRGSLAGATGSNPSDGQQIATTASSVSRRKFALVRDMEYDKFYDLVGFVVKTFQGFENFTIYITDYTCNPMLFNYEWGQTNMGWKGPWGQYTLQVTCWDINNDFAAANISEGNWVYLRNVRARMNSDSRLEGALHGDQRFKEKINVMAIHNSNDHDQVKAVIQRRAEYDKRFRLQSERYEKEMQKKIAEDQKREEEQRKREDEGNRNIRCIKPSHEVTLLGDIKAAVKSTKEPYLNHKYHVFTRVVDFLPARLEEFAKPVEPAEEDPEDEDTGPLADLPPDNEDGSKADGRKWEWRFALLLEGKDGVRQRVVVEGSDAEYLIKLTAVDLTKNPQTLATLREKLFVLWGSLEEHKSQSLSTTFSSTQNRLPTPKSSSPIQQQQQPHKKKRKHNRGAKGKEADKRRKSNDGQATVIRRETDDLGRRTTSDGDGEEEEAQGLGRWFLGCIAGYGYEQEPGKFVQMWRLTGTTID